MAKRLARFIFLDDPDDVVADDRGLRVVVRIAAGIVRRNGDVV